jgi:cell division septation protein DedD
MNKRLVIISVVGIILIGAVYWYTTRAPEAPPKPPALPRRVTKPRPPKPLTPIEPPERKRKVAKPPVAVAPPTPVKKRAVAPPEEEVPKAEAPVAVPPKVPPKAPSKKAKPAETPRETPKPAEPQAQAEKPAPEPPAKPTVPEVRERGRFSVQVASLVVKRNALSLKKRLEKLGYDPIIQKIKARITRHRVTAGEFRDREAADQTARSLGADGFSSRLVEGEHGQFAVEVGWSFNQNDAIDLARRLQKKDYSSKIVSKTAPTPVHVVRVGAYQDKAEARQVVKALKQKGFSPFVVVRR